MIRNAYYVLGFALVCSGGVVVFLYRHSDMWAFSAGIAAMICGGVFIERAKKNQLFYLSRSENVSDRASSSISEASDSKKERNIGILGIFLLASAVFVLVMGNSNFFGYDVNYSWIILVRTLVLSVPGAVMLWWYLRRRRIRQEKRSTKNNIE